MRITQPTQCNFREGEADKISRLDSYEQLNDVKFEGFSTNRKGKSDKGTNTLNRRTVAVRKTRLPGGKI